MTQPRLAKTPVETAIRTALWACCAIRERLGLQLQLSAEGEIDERVHIYSPHDDRHAATRFGHADHLAQHAVSVKEFHNRGGHRDVKTVVWKGDGLGVAFAKLDDLL